MNELHCHHSNIETMLKQMPDTASFNRVSDTFALISDASRLKILWLLCHCEECVNNIAAAVNMSSPAVSHHLRMLKQAGLLESRRDGKEMFYKLSSSPEAQLLHKAVDDIFDINCPK